MREQLEGQPGAELRFALALGRASVKALMESSPESAARVRADLLEMALLWSRLSHPREAVAILRETGLMSFQSPVDPEVFLYVLGALSLTTTLVLLVLPSRIVANATTRYRAASTDAQRDGIVLSTLLTSTLLRAAIVEGVGLFGSTAFLLMGRWEMLLAPAIALLVLLSFLPNAQTLHALAERLAREASL